jgi:hypothetical protein
MTIHVHATYRAGLIHPEVPLNLPDNTPVEVTIVPSNSHGLTPHPEDEPPRAKSPRITVEQFRAMLKEHSVSVGTLPIDFSRTDIYLDHD